MTILIDTSVLAAYSFSKDINHAKAKEFFHEVGDETRIVVTPVLSELFFFINKRIGYQRAIDVFKATCSGATIVSLATADLATMQAIMTRYADAKLDFTDVAIMAVAERLKITRIATFDRRDFALVRPHHTPHFDLLP